MGVSPMQHRRDTDATEEAALGNPLSVTPIPSVAVTTKGTELNQALITITAGASTAGRRFDAFLTDKALTFVGRMGKIREIGGLSG
jgi:hypothetical protein